MKLIGKIIALLIASAISVLTVQQVIRKMYQNMKKHQRVLPDKKA